MYFVVTENSIVGVVGARIDVIAASRQFVFRYFVVFFSFT